MLSPRELAAKAARERLVAALTRHPNPGPVHADTCYVWPAITCQVGCAHCNYAAPKHLGRLNRPKITQWSDRVLAMLGEMSVWRVSLSGGGEPMEEPDFCYDFVHGVESSRLDEIELITSAHFATDADEGRRVVANLYDAWRRRRDWPDGPRLTIRLSVDWFHAARIGTTPAANVIRALGEGDLRQIRCYIRGVLLEEDDTITQLARELRAELSPLADYTQTMTLPDGRAVKVYYKNLVFDGRMSRTKLERLPVKMPTASEIATFGERFRDPQGRHVPARTYNGPDVRNLAGLACRIEDNGAIRILEGNDPDRSPNVADFSSWHDAIDFLYADPVTVFLVREGPEALARLIGDRFPDALTVAEQTNQLYDLVELIIPTYERKLLATLRILEGEQGHGLDRVPAGLLEEAWGALR